MTTLQKLVHHYDNILHTIGLKLKDVGKNAKFILKHVYSYFEAVNPKNYKVKINNFVRMSKHRRGSFEKSES